MGTNKVTSHLDSDVQNRLLTACRSLQGREEGCYPELLAVQRAIQETHRELIAVGLEVACSHLIEELSPLQRELTQKLAEEVRNGSLAQIRQTAGALVQASGELDSLAA